VIKRRRVPDLQADRAVYRKILEDMVAHAGALIPDPNWLRADDISARPGTYDQRAALQTALSDHHFASKIAQMNQLMHAWVGGSDVPTTATIQRYLRFMEHCDPLTLWSANVGPSAASAPPFFRQDLGSLMDLSLLYSFGSDSGREVTRILEVGGGYGRLAEAAFNVFGRSIKYVMVDAVPASLYYAPIYLAHACPEARVRSYYDGGGEPLDVSDCDIAVVPAWHLDKIAAPLFDICINIESMQEMNQAHVDHYLRVFEAASVDDALIYLSNAHDYYFRGEFYYPPHWRREFCANTPRSWRPHHPTEIFRKAATGRAMENQALKAIYQYGRKMDEPAEYLARKGIGALAGPILRKAAATFSR
jgi:hypothetical protein